MINHHESSIYKSTYCHAENKCIHHLFAEQVARTPDNVAVVYEKQQLTYCELNAKANQLARYIKKQYEDIFHQELVAETLVGLLIDRSLEMLVGVLGILKAGCAYVPLDPDLPKERLKFIITDAKLRLLITKSQLIGKVKDFIATEQEASQCEVICIDEDASLIAKERPQNISAHESTVNANNLAYVIYTSGSTGKPKGVLIEHHNVVRLFAATQEQFNFNAQDVWTMFHSFAFDFSVWEIWGALLHGGKLIVVPYWVSRSPEDFHALVESEKVTVLNQTPAAFAQFISIDAKTTTKLHSLRYVIFGGEALVLASLEPWIKKYGLSEPILVNMYGITETTVHVTFLFLTLEDIASGKNLRSPIGGCIKDLFIYVVDEFGKEVKVGEIGELYVGGAGLARGYLNRPELTAEKFINTQLDAVTITGDEGDGAHGSAPFTFDACRVYKTGDVVRKLSDGKLDYIGRADNQVKIRGFRIELGEIEEVLRAYKGIKQCIVVVRECAGYKQLIGYYITDKNQLSTISQKDLFVHLKQQLPSYMIPTCLLELDALPLTANGKIDKHALPDLGIRKIYDDNYVAPRTDEEKILQAIWCDVLQQDKIGITDNFFTLGGDSIRAIQIVSRAREQGFYFTSRQLLTNSTIAELVTHIEKKKITTIDHDEVFGEVLLGPIQKRYFRTAHQNYHTFYQACVFPLDQVLTMQQVGCLLNQLVAHHDILRARFTPTRSEGKWLQIIPKKTNNEIANHFVCEEINVDNKNNFHDEKLLVSIMEKLQGKLNIEKGPLIAVGLLAERDKKYSALLLVIHHLVIDGISWRILYEDIKSLARQVAGQQTIFLSAKTTSMQKYAQALYAYLSEAEKEWAYWLNVGKSIDINHKFCARKLLNKDMQHHLVFVDKNVTHSLLHDIALKFHTQINDILLTALLLAINDWSGAEEVLIQLEGHGREDCLAGVDCSRTVGWFTSFFPVHLQLPDDWCETKDLASVIKHVKETLRSIPNKGLGYAILRFLSNDPRAKVLDELENKCSICFNYLGVLESKIYEADLAINQVNTNARLFEINAWVEDGELIFDVAYNSLVCCNDSSQKFTILIKKQLTTLMNFCNNEQYCYHTPSDFPLAKINQEFLDKLANSKYAIEDIYALAPLQQGLLFHSIYAPTSDQYCVQIHWRCHALLDIPRLIQAWETLIRQHAVLRTAFVWEGVLEPLQLVYSDAAFDWQDLDWSAMNGKFLDDSLKKFLAQDRSKPFDLTKPGLMRFYVLDLGGKQYELIWSSHHIILDGWCMPIIFKLLQENYNALMDETTSPFISNSNAYKNYIVWFNAQDKLLARQFWQNMLHDVKASTGSSMGNENVLNLHKPITNLTRQKLVFSKELQYQAKKFTQDHKITLNALLQFVWAIMLAKRSGSSEVIFGTVVSGRPEELDHVENILGLFVNTLPIRVRLAQSKSAIEQIQELVLTINDINKFSYLPLHEVQKFAPTSGKGRFFDSIFDCENIPLNIVKKNEPLIFDLSHASIWEKTNYPLTLNVLVSAELTVVFSYDAEVFSFADIERLINDYKTALEWLLTNASKNLSELNILNSIAWQRTFVDMNNDDGNTAYHQQDTYCPPKSYVEEVLARIWQDLLQIEKIGIKDNFFSLGGDSIISIQMVSRAREHGAHLKVPDLFSYPTIEELARHVNLAPEFNIDQGLSSGEVLLTPIQQWFFANNFFQPNYYNQSFLLYLNERITLDEIRTIFTFLAKHHDGLRLRFKQSNGLIEQFYSDDFAVDITEINSTDYDCIGGFNDGGSLLECVCNKMQSSLDIENGPILKVALFIGEDLDRHKLFIVIHHLVIDGVSWRILFDDFARLYTLIKTRQPLSLPRKTSSFAAWGQALKNHLRQAYEQLDYWLAVGKNASVIEGDYLENLNQENKKTLFIELDQINTERLLKKVPATYGAQINDILLAALALAFYQWRGVRNLLVDLEGHGRESCVAGVDVSRTIGWFTNIYPVCLDITEAVKKVDYFSATIAYTKAALLAIKDKGISFSVLKYLADEQTSDLLRQRHSAKVLFNYLGVIDGPQQLFVICPTNFNADIDPHNKLSYLFEFNSFVLDDKLKIFLDFQATRFKESSAVSLMSTLQAILNELMTNCAMENIYECE